MTQAGFNVMIMAVTRFLVTQIHETIEVGVLKNVHQVAVWRSQKL